MSQRDLEVVNKVLDLFGDDPSKWIQGASARDADGKTVHLASARYRKVTPTCFCLYGAFRWTLLSEADSQSYDFYPYNRFEDFVANEIDENICPVQFNDHPDRKFSDIKGLLLKYKARLTEQVSKENG